ncbi:adenine-specific DNA-methyltransferase [Microcoleus sp. S36b_A3]|uniref:adenine-specific DNA-methyltransferase n=1 Tax=unclassified Microcoleus TaxID=2642155 RepID=UPI002FD0F2BD
MNFFEIDGHKLFLGDVLEVLESQVKDNSIDLIFADPPYNIGKNFNGFKDKWELESDYLEWSYKWLNLCINKLKHNGSLYLMASTQSMPYFDLYLRDRLTVLARIVWYYDSSGVQAKKYYGSLYEPILYCVKDKRNYTFNSSDILVEAKTGAVRKLIDYRKSTPSVYNSQKVPGNVWEFSRVRYRMPEYEEHPTQKPTLLLERIIKASSNEGDVVLDIFSGTFTTSFVAKQLKRKSIGIEFQEKYLEIGLRRLGITADNSEEDVMSEVNSGENSPKQLTLNLQL